MTFMEYKKYERKVAAFFKRENIKHMSMDNEAEPFFSWRSCDCCGCNLGGDRYTMNVIFNDNQDTDITYDICPDCLYYNEYGSLDDMTMMNMAEETAKAKALDKIKAEDDWGTEPAKLTT